LDNFPREVFSSRNSISVLQVGGLVTKEKDAINELLRKSRLTSIQENTEASSSSSGDEATVRYLLR
jgi:hypothetical protein